MMSPAAGRPYSPIDSTDPVDLHQHKLEVHSDRHSAGSQQELTLGGEREPDLLNGSGEYQHSTDLEEGPNSHSHNHSAALVKQHSNQSDYGNQDSSTSPNTGTSQGQGQPQIPGGVSNRIVVGAAQRASRGVHSSGTNSLAGTPISAPYLPPPRIECGRCQIMRPRDASHCHDCGVCVKKLDHHCPVSILYT